MLELNKIYCMDCIEGMAQFPDKYFDWCIADPPYGIKMDKGFTGAGGFNGNGKAIGRTKYNYDYDSEKLGKDYFEEIKRISKNFIIFGGNYYTDFFEPSNNWLIWHKHNTSPFMSDGEMAITSSGGMKIIDYVWNGLIQENMKNKEIRTHPNQKPIGLYERIIHKYKIPPKSKIIDPFLGSGSSIIAYSNMDISFIAFEIDKDIFADASKRIADHKAQMTIFEVM